ncbi:MAG: hypothetical protein JWP07_916, partial [Pseudonocardiales bacterium]|nr:hypothetical protein [Pseudonocardiales bacterium]
MSTVDRGTDPEVEQPGPAAEIGDGIGVSQVSSERLPQGAPVGSGRV